VRPSVIPTVYPTTGSLFVGRTQGASKVNTIGAIEDAATVGETPSGSWRNCGQAHLNAERPAVERLELEQQLAVLDGLRVGDVDPPDDRLDLRLHLVHQLHRLQDAQNLPG
jgi:hypothetical protein